MRTTVAVALDGSTVGLFWLLSLRRTPYALMWLMASIAWCVAWVALASATKHVTVGGSLAIDAGAIGVVALIAVITEACVQDHRDIYRWRQDRRKGGTWQIEAREDHGMVKVGLRSGGTLRLIGRADPISNMEAYSDLVAKAQEAQSTMNALKIRPSDA